MNSRQRINIPFFSPNHTFITNTLFNERMTCFYWMTLSAEIIPQLKLKGIVIQRETKSIKCNLCWWVYHPFTIGSVQCNDAVAVPKFGCIRGHRKDDL